MDQKYPNHLYWTSSLCENGRYDIAFDVHMKLHNHILGNRIYFEGSIQQVVLQQKDEETHGT